MPPTAADQLGSFGDRVGDVSLNFLDGFMVDQWTLGHALRATVADFQSRYGGRQLLDEAIVHCGLHIDAIGAHAGLTHIPELGQHQAHYQHLISVSTFRDSHPK